MQIKNWDDLRLLLAVKRGISFSGAARLLGVDSTTVSRRLSAFQTSLDTRLYQRLPDGSLQLTPQGESLALQAETMDRQIDLIGEALGQPAEACSGTVRLTSVPIIVNRLLAPQMGRLISDNPELTMELVPDSRDFSLTRREADMAVRLARPSAGGHHVKARRIGLLDYAVYALRSLPSDEAAELPWITYEDGMSHIPQARWMMHASKTAGGQLAGLRVQDAETAYEAVLAGLGRSVLPRMIGGQDKRLRELDKEEGTPPLPSRELWLLVHADLVRLRRISTVTAWIESVLGRSNI